MAEKTKKIDGIDAVYKRVIINNREKNLDYFGRVELKYGVAGVSQRKYEEICNEADSFLDNFNNMVEQNERMLKKALENNDIFDFAYKKHLELKEKYIKLINNMINKAKTGQIYFDFKVFGLYTKDLFGSLKLYNHLDELLNKNVEEASLPCLKYVVTEHRFNGTYTEYENCGVREQVKKATKLNKLAEEKVDYEFNYLYTKIKERTDLVNGFDLKFPDGITPPKREDKYVLERHKNILCCLELLYKKAKNCEYFIDFSSINSRFLWSEYDMEQIYQYLCDLICMLAIIKLRIDC